ncbi:tripartite motif containing 2 [Homo sapiens]|uniref:Tripartite motif containing 2 n=1 Tax=Homo sapiens TaxID=9606 RepID=A0A6Q8PGF3_HUMAN|nr:tripartite motif containing 2 [Homo sapiens]KAI2536228.1 tripartite motif containing 2 [Homo sapiens]KAI4027373.1 tripartite motif containing 2 [Homo sapiens]KAI4027376.1 tripartite motif containing 2 [Homo sapiens]
MQRAGSKTAGPPCQWSRMASEGTNIPSPVVRQIDKQFLICSICLERYKNPKVLPCLHTFCESVPPDLHPARERGGRAPEQFLHHKPDGRAAANSRQQR